jgi:hypothetical protein
VDTYATIFRDYVEGQWADPDDFIEAGDLILVLGRLRGRAKATGEEYEVHFAHVWRSLEVERRATAFAWIRKRRRSWKSRLAAGLKRTL